MIGHHDIWLKYSKRLKVYSVCAASFAALIAGLQQFNPENWSEEIIFSYILSVAQSNAKYIIPLCGLIVILVELSERIYGSAKIWAVVHHILDEMHSCIFPPDCNKAENRVTLFQAKRFHLTWPWRAWPPWGCWLVPVERSHHLTRKSHACFQVKDNGEAEGVAGQVYVQRTCIHIENLPNIFPDSGGNLPKLNLKFWFYKNFWKARFLNDKQKKAIKIYSTKTWANESKIIRQRVAKKNLTRFLCGLTVDVEGQIWGVIVVDSRTGKLLDKVQIATFFNENAGVLSKLLEYIK
jgi:hypothetical protein